MEHNALKGAWDKTGLFVGDRASADASLRHPNAWDHDSVVKLAFETIGARHASYEETCNAHIATGVVAFAASTKTKDRSTDGS